MVKKMTTLQTLQPLLIRCEITLLNNRNQPYFYEGNEGKFTKDLLRNLRSG